MAARNLFALFAVPLFSTGCATMRFEIPATEATQLATGTVRSIEGRYRTLEPEYTLWPIANPGEVLLRSETDQKVIHSYPKKDALDTPLLRLEDAPVMRGPVNGRLQDSILTLTSPDDQIVVPVGSLTSLRIVQVDRGRTTEMQVGIGVGGLLIGALVVAVLASSVK